MHWSFFFSPFFPFSFFSFPFFYALLWGIPLFSFLLLIHFQIGSQSRHHFAAHITKHFSPFTYFLFSYYVKIIFLILLFNTIYLFILGHTCTISTPSTYITKKIVLHSTPYLYPFLYYHLPQHLLLMLSQDLSATTFSQYLCLIETATFSGMDSAFLYIGYGRWQKANEVIHIGEWYDPCNRKGRWFSQPLEQQSSLPWNCKKFSRAKKTKKLC